MQFINKNQTINATSAVVSQDRSALNNSRRAIIITNTSLGGQEITIAVGQEAVAGEGIILYAGGSWDRNPQENPPQVQISAISSAVGGTIAVYEETEEVQ
jgi:hypothetical protein